MTYAERQHVYDARKNEICERVNISLNLTSERQLERLAKHYGVTKRHMLAKVLSEAESRTVEDVEDKLVYFDEAIA